MMHGIRRSFVATIQQVVAVTREMPAHLPMVPKSCVNAKRCLNVMVRWIQAWVSFLLQSEKTMPGTKPSCADIFHPRLVVLEVKLAPLHTVMKSCVKAKGVKARSQHVKAKAQHPGLILWG
mmetsp:Transcript_103536/g.198742  ORF Transcript_103536/g.198742 Transcript_103536/m.198742 type:complete len:121 (+) Transcript_103536:458-820(+)